MKGKKIFFASLIMDKLLMSIGVFSYLDVQLATGWERGPAVKLRALPERDRAEPPWKPSGWKKSKELRKSLCCYHGLIFIRVQQLIYASRGMVGKCWIGHTEKSEGLYFASVVRTWLGIQLYRMHIEAYISLIYASRWMDPVRILPDLTIHYMGTGYKYKIHFLNNQSF